MGWDSESMLDRYLDGLLPIHERVTFERHLESEASLAGQVAVQRRIDAAAARCFLPPDVDRLASDILTRVMERSPRERQHRLSFRTRRLLAVAAAIGAVVFAGYQLWTEFGPRTTVGPYKLQAWRSLERVYTDTVAAGFVPQWVCKDDREFENTFRKRLGQGLALLPPPPGIAWAGVDYCNSITPQTLSVLAYVDGREVLVFSDRASRDTGQGLPPESRLNLFRRQIGGLMLYECTPFENPRLLDLFYHPRVDGP